MAKISTQLLLGMALFSTVAMADSTGQSAFNDKADSLMAEFNQSKTQMFDEFAKSKAAYKASFDAYKKELSQYWDKPELTSKSTWVQYSKDNQVKRAVNFETGDIIIEVVGKDLTEKQIEQKVTEQLTELEQQTTEQAFKKDRVINSQKPNKLVAKQKMLPDVNVKKLEISEQPSKVKQANGLTITRVAYKAPATSMAKKSMIYMPTVLAKSEKWDVDADLILAIMHTESHFNPMAQSAIPAYGLMQVVPTSAGKDVTKRYQGKAKLLSPETLFNPNFNIEIGTSYLNILMSHYLKNVEDPLSRTYLAIAAYNGGIGTVARHFTGKKSLNGLAKKANTLTPEYIYNSLISDFPFEETRNYLKKVHGKQGFYKKSLTVASI